MSANTAESRFHQICCDIETEIETWPEALQHSSRIAFREIAASPFSRVAALMPFHLAPLCNTPAKVCHQLAEAQLFGWWYYAVQDKLLDGEIDAAALPAAHVAWLHMRRRYDDLTPNNISRKPLQELVQRAANAYTLETRSRLQPDQTLPQAALTVWRLPLLLDRMAVFFFNPWLQLQLAGLRADAPPGQHVLAFLAALLLCRQLNDDRSDWLDDLQAGRLNYVSARLLRRHQHRRPNLLAPRLDVLRLAGLAQRDEGFWRRLENTLTRLLSLAEAAAQQLPTPALGTLWQAQAAAVTRQNQQQQHQRWAWQAAFGLERLD